MIDQYKVVISDCHLSAGRYFEGKFNPHEDFFFDQEMIEFFEFFSSGLYGDGADGPVSVELVINGDYFDFLNVPYLGEFEEGITEEIALVKLEAIIAGHPRVMDALRKFASKPNKKITYLIGNHDAELFFEKVRERIIKLWDPEGEYPSEKVEIVEIGIAWIMKVDCRFAMACNMRQATNLILKDHFKNCPMEKKFSIFHGEVFMF